MKSGLFAGVAVLAMLGAGSAAADGFVNGGFESGDITGWTQGGGFRGGVDNANLSPDYFNGGGGINDGGRGAVLTNHVDPNVGAALGSTVHSGTYSYRAENTVSGGFATYIQQQVDNYTDANIFFAWKSVLLGAHGPTDAATMIIRLTDLTTGTDVITREYNAADDGSGIDGRFSLLNGNYYTPDWQVEQLAIDRSLTGHDFLLTVLGADCAPTAHHGYVYLDGFGAAPPTGAVPEPGTWALLITGFGAVGMVMRRRRQPMASAA